MPSELKSNLHIKKHYVRMTFGQKIMLCEMAHNNAAQRDVQALREWAARAFDLPQLPSAASIYEVLRNEKKYRAVPKDTHRLKKFVDPAAEELDRALLTEFDTMEENLTTITDYALMYRAKLFVDAHFGHLAADKRPGFSKGWAYRFRKRHGIRCIRKQGEAASVKQSDIVKGRESMQTSIVCTTSTTWLKRPSSTTQRLPERCRGKEWWQVSRLTRQG
ncbi:hypothetical protein DVH05_022081 [Phytophthora capsici]|nr:hypothetical protein DVH05_022081 [Phytophthora capsici]